MKRIINGKMYNTETAELIHSWDNGRYGNDFKARSKELYQTKKGAWFLRHDGGAMTDMAVSVGSNSTGGSCSIEVISAEDTFQFLCSHEGTEIAEKYFPKMIEEA